MKKFQKKKEGSGLFQGVFMAYFILLLHVLLMAGLGCLVLFFRGFLQYMLWIFLGGATLLTYSGYRIYKRMKYEHENFSDILRLPSLNGRSFELQFLGGIASIKVGGSSDNYVIDIDRKEPLYLPKLEDAASVRVRELSELARLFENKLITLDEYNQSKKQLLNNGVIS